MFISFILELKKSARFCSLISGVMLPMYNLRDCLERLGLLPIPMPNVCTGMGGGKPGIARIGGIWVRLAPGKLNRPITTVSKVAPQH